MKTFIVATLLSILSVEAQAQVYFKSVSLCSSWNYSNGGYTCSFPMSEYIPDQFSLNNKITTLENRIATLEKKISQMETLILQQQNAQ